ncbi:hypothetical protein E4U61_004527 [Claviceps capensis]|nr:hypothetical protein E4U61_004527 [Claviceps capensis]
MASDPIKEVFDDLSAKFDALGMRPGSPSKTSTEKLSFAQIPKRSMILNPESRPLHPKFINFDKYVSEGWPDSEDTALDLRTATQTDLNDRVVCLVKSVLGGRGFEQHPASASLPRLPNTGHKAIWNRVQKEVRTKLRNTLRDNGVPTAALETVADGLARLTQQGYQTSGETESEEPEDESAVENGEDNEADGDACETVGYRLQGCCGNSVVAQSVAEFRSNFFMHSILDDLVPYLEILADSLMQDVVRNLVLQVLI